MKMYVVMLLQKQFIFRPCPFVDICTRAVNSTYTYCESLGILKFHGDSCNMNADYYTNNCLNNKCVGKADGESCKEDYECGKESFCMKNNYTKYATEGETCSRLMMVQRSVLKNSQLKQEAKVMI